MSNNNGVSEESWLRRLLQKQSDANWDRINGGPGVIRWPQTQPKPQQPKPQPQKATGQR